MHEPHEALGQRRARQHPRDPLARQAGAPRRLEHDAVARQQRPRDLRRAAARTARCRRRSPPPRRTARTPPARAARATSSGAPPRAWSPSTRAPSSAIQISASIAASSSSARDLRPRAALLAADQLRQLVELVDDRLRHAAHVARAVLHAQQRPQRLHLARGAHHVLHLLRRGGLHAAQDRPGRRVARAQRRRCGGLRLRSRRCSCLSDYRPPLRPRGTCSQRCASCRLGLVGLVEARAGHLLGEQLLRGEVPRVVVRVVVAADLLARPGPRAQPPRDRRRAVLAHVALRGPQRAAGRVGLRRQRRGRWRPAPARSAPPASPRARPPAPPRPRRPARPESALPMSSEARITMRRTMKRGSSPPSSITAR